jgi:protein gp37
MGYRSGIEWTESTWNPVTGCTKISPGCRHCYAERMALRLKAMGQSNYRAGFQITLHRHALRLPFGWKAPQRIFVNSMSDLFHEDIPDSFIVQVFDTMRTADWHVYQVLTKRSDRFAKMASSLPWPSHIWMGATVENQQCTFRIDHLRQSSAAVKFLSLEPLLGPLPGLDVTGIDWVIAGGESGPGARPMDPRWATGIRDRCVQQGVPFFFKQWGGVNKKKTGRTLDGRTWDQMPAMPDRARNP